jgi:transketolase
MSSLTTLSSDQLAQRIRSLALKMVHQAKASHIGSALSITDIVAVLFADVLHFDPADPEAAERDRLILSKGHACTAIYAALAEAGFFGVDCLAEYGKDHSIFMTHISHKVPGVEFSTGSLGHGLPFGVGKALAAGRMGANWKTFVILSDGELDEGSNWEAFLFASHHHLDHLVAIIDYNKLQSLTTVDATLQLEPLSDKLRAFGWSVREVDGHSHSLLRESLAATPWEPAKPSVLIARTTKGKGVSFMENQVEWHYRSPSDVLLDQALSEVRG